MFFKHHKKWIALLTTFAFFWLIHVSGLPLRAETAASTTRISADQQPGAIEQPAPAGYARKKNSPLIPIIIGVVVVGAVAAVLILVVFKTKYDITGQWTMTRVGNVWGTDIRYLTFTGDKKSGTLAIGFTGFGDSNPDIGIYTADGKNVDFTQQYSYDPNDYRYRYIGTFTDKNTMSGTFSMEYGWVETGTWTAIRFGTAAVNSPTPVAANESEHHRSK